MLTVTALPTVPLIIPDTGSHVPSLPMSKFLRGLCADAGAEMSLPLRSAVSVTVLWIGIADAVLTADTDVRGRMCPSLFLCL